MKTTEIKFQDLAWVNIQDKLPPNESIIVRVRRKSDAALAGPREWKMWACNVRMHTDEVGWWMLDNQEIK